MAGWVIAITRARGNAEESLAAGFGKLFRDKGLASKEQVLFFFPETADAPESSIPKMQSTPSAFVPLDELETCRHGDCYPPLGSRGSERDGE